MGAGLLVNENSDARHTPGIAGQPPRNEGGQAAFREGAQDRAVLRTWAMIPIPYALDALNFLASDVRNLFGPFVNVFLVTSRLGARPMSDW
jgi:hypothetical protein